MKTKIMNAQKQSEPATRTIPLVKLEHIFQIFEDIKKELSYDKHTGEWAWRDRDEPYENRHDGHATALAAMLDAVEHYLNPEE